MAHGGLPLTTDTAVLCPSYDLTSGGLHGTSCAF